MAEIESESKTNEEEVTKAMASLRQLIDKQEKDLIKQIRTGETNEKKTVEDYKQKLQGEQQGLIEEIFKVVAVCKDKQPKKLLDAKRSFEDYIKRMDSRLLELKPLTRIKNQVSGTDKIKELETQIRSIKLEQKKKHENAKLRQDIANNTDKSRLKLASMQLKDEDMELVADELKINNVRKHYFFLSFRLFAISQNCLYQSSHVLSKIVKSSSYACFS